MNDQWLRAIDLTGAVAVIFYFLLIITVFVLRLMGSMEAARWVGIASFATVIPMALLLVTAFKTVRPPIYFLWVGLAITFLIGELVIDDLLKLPFRTVTWATIVYVVIFFAATGGMIGLAAQAGTWWKAISVVLFLVMAVLAFVQRARTGL